ncbi:MAG: hypothetical protein K2X03_20115 [Bryobacteraceae bacterium]|nr:hypothetical protein [Bryobacteraceae bacterium]
MTKFVSDAWLALANLPTPAWALIGSLIGSTISIIGVISTNRAHERRLRTQLVADSEQNRLDRLLTLRREVYLAAASEAVKGGGFLGKLSGFDLAQLQKADGLTNLNGELAKMQLIAEPETALLIGQLANAWAEAYSRLFTFIIPLLTVKHDLKQAEVERDEAEVQLSSARSQLREASTGGAMEDRVFAVLEHSVDGAELRLKDALQQIVSLSAEIPKAQLEFMPKLAEEMRIISAATLPVISAVRSELGINSILTAHMIAQWENGWQKEKQLRALMVEAIKKVDES